MKNKEIKELLKKEEGIITICDYGPIVIKLSWRKETRSQWTGSLLPELLEIETNVMPSIEIKSRKPSEIKQEIGYHLDEIMDYYIEKIIIEGDIDIRKGYRQKDIRYRTNIIKAYIQLINGGLMEVKNNEKS